MKANKVVFGAVSIMDIGDSTVTPETLKKGVTAYDKSGEKITGTMTEKTPVLQEKSVTPSTSAQTVTPDSNYDGLSKVNVGAMPTATQATPSISVNSSGLITASATQSAGYVAAGTKSGTKQLTTQAAKTVTPTTSEQTVVAAGRYTTGAIKVAKIPSDYIKPSGTKSITENGTHDVKSYESVNVNVNVTGSSLVSFNLVNGGGTHVLYVNENDQIVQAVQSGTYQAKGGILIHSYEYAYEYSAGTLGVIEVDKYWEYIMVAFEDGFTLTLDT